MNSCDSYQQLQIAVTYSILAAFKDAVGWAV